MKRDLAALGSAPFECIVIGGGIVGACVARDAALRGLRVALIEKRDFAAGTSWNSLKIVHGGLRYLQSADFGRMRASIKERSTWLRIAPHLVEPLPVLLPTYRRGIQRRPLLRAAFAVNDLVSWDRNRGLPDNRRLPRGRLLSRGETLELVPQLEGGGLTGGAVFYDAQMYSGERLVMSVVRSAAAAGAVVVNYVEFVEPLRRSGRLIGVRARDTLGAEEFDIRARIVVNAAGPATPSIAARLTGRPAAAAVDYSVAMNVIVPGLGPRVAFTMSGSPGEYRSTSHGVGRQLFFVPWRGHTLIGTGHYRYDGDPADFRVADEYLTRFLAEVNSAWPERSFTPEDAEVIHSGLLPVSTRGGPSEVSLLKRHRIVDHAKDGQPNAISAISVKFTTARLVAEGVVDLARVKLERPAGHCVTHEHPLAGAPEGGVGPLISDAGRRYAGTLDREVVEHLVRIYGNELDQVLRCRDSARDWSERPVAGAPVIKAQWLHAAREEMACTAEDLVHRRTELGARGMASEAVIEAAAEVLRPQGHAAIPQSFPLP